MVCFWDGFVSHWVYNSLQDEVFWVPRTGKPTIGLDELQEFTDPKWAGLRIITPIPPIQWSTDATWSIQKMFHAMYPLCPHIFLVRSFTRVTVNYQDIPKIDFAHHQFLLKHQVVAAKTRPLKINWNPQFFTVGKSPNFLRLNPQGFTDTKPMQKWSKNICLRYICSVIWLYCSDHCWIIYIKIQYGKLLLLYPLVI